MPAKVQITAKSRGGLRTVTYRDASGHSSIAKVVAPGSGSGLKLLVNGGSQGRRIVDNVPLATGLKQTNVYTNR
jgi:hypothetical protein